MVLDTDALSASKVSDGAQDVLTSRTIPDGELWLVAEYAGTILTHDHSGITGDTHAIQLEIKSGQHADLMETQVLARCDLNDGSNDLENNGVVSRYAYGGDTVQLRENSDDMDAASELAGTVYMRRVL